MRVFFVLFFGDTTRIRYLLWFFYMSRELSSPSSTSDRMLLSKLLNIAPLFLFLNIFGLSDAIELERIVESCDYQPGIQGLILWPWKDSMPYLVMEVLEQSWRLWYSINFSRASLTKIPPISSYKYKQKNINFHYLKLPISIPWPKGPAELLFINLSIWSSSSVAYLKRKTVIY